MTYGNEVGDVCGRSGYRSLTTRCGGIIKEYPDGSCYCPFCRWVDRDDNDDYYDD